MIQWPRQPWDEYRERRRLLWLALIGYLPGVLLLGTLLQRAVGLPMGVVAVGWLGFICFAILRWNTLSCPRCGRWFHATAVWHDPFAQACLHCGLPKWERLRTRDRAGRG